MAADITIHHAIAITGKVSDTLTGMPLPGVLVEITQGPPEFESIRSILAENPGWNQLTERIDQTISRADGCYFLLDLPSGTYHLKFSLPAAGHRYGDYQADGSTVLGQRDANGRISITTIDAALTPTQIQGKVIRKDNNQPVPGAKVGLQGDETQVLSDANGHYIISDLTAIKPTLAASADKFKPFSQGLTLTPGAVQTVNISLEPV